MKFTSALTLQSFEKEKRINLKRLPKVFIINKTLLDKANKLKGNKLIIFKAVFLRPRLLFITSKLSNLIPD